MFARKLIFWGAVLSSLLATCTLSGETRAAVLIGIDTYSPKSPSAAKPAASPLRRPAARGNWSAWYYPDLEGSVNDIKLMESILSTDKLGFKDISVLTNEKATAEAILSLLQRKLVDEASAGDIRFVYYSGHGGTVRNEASTERFNLDQTIVPADHYRGDVPDIRDKELSRILWKAGKKGVRVIFIADSCHSGGLSRGAWNQRGLTRTARSSPNPDVKPYPVQISDPADKDPETKKDINPVDAGVIVLAAAQEDESAQEDTSTADGTHGAFTWALKRALEQGLDQPLDLVVRRAGVLLKAADFAQSPDLKGRDVHNTTMFGLKPSAVASTTALVQSAEASGGKIVIRGGKAIGIYEGTELKRILKAGGPVEIRVTRSLDLVRSEATVLEKGESAAPIQENDVFEVEKWVVPDEPMLKVYVPPAAPPETVLQVAAEAGRLRQDKTVQWVNDLTESTAAQVMYWNGKQWVLERNPATGKPDELGVTPTQADIRKHLSEKTSFFLLLPPTTTLVSNLMLRQSDDPARPSSITVLESVPGQQAPQSPGGDQYRLIGRLNGSATEYAWIQPDSTEESVRRMALDKDVSRRLPLPLRTDWIPLGTSPESVARAGEDLTDKAFRLGRLRSWVTLLSPPSAADLPFPWRLAFREAGQNGFVTGNETKGGHRYKIYLRADPQDLAAGVPERYVYLFSIDHYGKGTLIFPPLGEGNAGNRFPKRKNGKLDVPAEMPLMDGPYDFEVAEPYGVDTFMLLTSKEPIEDPRIFEFDGVRTKGATRGAGYRDQLTQLLSEVGAQHTRGIRGNPAVPSTWSLEQVPMLSSPK